MTYLDTDNCYFALLIFFFVLSCLIEIYSHVWHLPGLGTRIYCWCYTWGCQATEVTLFLIKVSFAKCAAQWVIKKKNTCGVIFFVECEMKWVFYVYGEDLCKNTLLMIFSFISIYLICFCCINASAAFYSSCSPSQNITCGRFSLLFSFNPSSLCSCCLFQPSSFSLISPLLPFPSPPSLWRTPPLLPLLLFFRLNCK